MRLPLFAVAVSLLSGESLQALAPLKHTDPGLCVAGWSLLLLPLAEQFARRILPPLE